MLQGILLVVGGAILGKLISDYWSPKGNEEPIASDDIVKDDNYYAWKLGNMSNK